MKNYILMLLVLFIFSSFNVYSSSEVFESLEVDEDGDPTGQTVVYELEWISQDTLQISVSTRASAAGDEVYLYNETSYSEVQTVVTCGTMTLNGLEFNGGTNTKYVPFEEQFSYVYTKVEDSCLCEGTNNCGGVIDPGCQLGNWGSGFRCSKIKDSDLCSAPNMCVHHSKVYNGGSVPYEGYGGGILIEADNIVFVIE
jgi:hypothetical protein